MIRSAHGLLPFYTKVVDPTGATKVPVLAYEHFESADDPMQPGTCTPYDVGSMLLGVLTTATDPALANWRCRSV
jgi:hypothetical protein